MIRRALVACSLAFLLACGALAAADPAAAERQFRVARRLVAEGSPQAAAELAKVVELDPAGSLADDALIEQALLAGAPRWPEELGRIGPGPSARALSLLSRVIRELPGADRAAQATYLHGLLLLEPLPHHDATVARRDLISVATDTSQPEWAASARYAVAFLAEQQGHVERAATTYQRLVIDAEQDPAAVRAMAGLARILVRDGRYGAAARWLQRAIEAGVDDTVRAVALRETAVRSLLEQLGRRTVGAPKKSPGTGVKGPTGFTSTASGQLLLADRRGAAAILFDLDGRPAERWVVEDPQAAAVARNGWMYVAAGESVLRLLVGQPPIEIASQGEFSPAQSLAVDGRGGIWLLDRRGENITRIDPGGPTAESFWSGRGRKLASLTWDGRRLVAVDTKEKTLLAIDSGGKERTIPLLDAIKPIAVAADASGRLGVLDGKALKLFFLRDDSPAGERDLRAAGVARPARVAFTPAGNPVVFDDADGSWVRFP